MEDKLILLSQLKAERDNLEADISMLKENKDADKLTIDKYSYYLRKINKQIAEIENNSKPTAITESKSPEARANLKRQLENTKHELGLLLSSSNNPETAKRKALLKEMKRDLSRKLNSVAPTVSFNSIDHPNKALLEAHKVNYIDITSFIYKYFKEHLGVPVEISPGTYEGELKIFMPKYAQHTNKEFTKIMKDLKEIDNHEEPVAKNKSKKEPVIDKVCKDLQKKMEAELDVYISLYPTKFGYNASICDPATSTPVYLTEATTKEEYISKDEVKKEVNDSNIVLDNKFIWVFAVLDEYSESLAEDIYSIEEAIGQFVDNEPEAVMIVAYPYVDPNPEDPNVELVFADNPGPVIIYDMEKATKPKPEKEKELARQELEDIEANKQGIRESTQNKTFYDVVLDLSEAFNTLERSKFDNIIKQLVDNKYLDGVLKAIVELVKASDDAGVTQDLNKLGGYIYNVSKQMINSPKKDSVNPLRNLVDKVKSKTQV